MDHMVKYGWLFIGIAVKEAMLQAIMEKTIIPHLILFILIQIIFHQIIVMLILLTRTSSF